MADPSTPEHPHPQEAAPPAAPRFVQPYPGAPPVPVTDPYGAFPVPPSASAAPLPPYAAHSGYPGAPVAAPGSPPPGSPPPSGTPSAPYPPAAGAPAPPGTGRRRALGILAMWLAIGGAVIAVIPFLNLLSAPLLIAAIVLAIVALLSPGPGGTGFGIAALAVSGATICIAVIVAVVAFFLAIAEWGTAIRNDAFDDAAPPPYQAEPEVSAVDPVLVETAFGTEDAGGGRWWYAVVVDNPNADAVFDYEEFVVTALDAAGVPLTLTYEYLTILPGTTAVAGTFEDLGDAEVASIEVTLPAAASASPRGFAYEGELAVQDVQNASNGVSTFISGVVSSTLPSDAQVVLVSLIARDATGTITAATRGYADLVPGGGTAGFAAVFTPALTEGTTVEAYPVL